MMPLVQFLVLLGALVGALMILWRPYWGFLLVLRLFVFEQLLQSYSGLLQERPQLFNYTVGMVAAMAVFLRVCRREPIFSGLNNAVTYLIFAQFSMWLLGMLHSPSPEAVQYSITSAAPYLVLYLCLLPLLILDLGEFRKVLVGLLVLGVILTLLIILNPHSMYYQGRLTLDTGLMGVDRLGNPLALAEFGAMVALVAALIVPRGRSISFTVLRAGAFILGLGLAIGSGSRGQVLAAAAVSILFYPVARRVKNVRGFLLSSFGFLILVAGLYFAFHLFIGEENRARWDTSLMVEHVGSRFEMASLMLEAYLESPGQWLLGLGTNAWSSLAGASEFQGGYVHNLAVEILCEQGLVGATIFVATIVLVIRSGGRLWWIHRDDPSMRATVAIFLALGGFGLLLALKQGSITSGIPFYWWLVLAKLSRREESLLASSLAHEEAEYALAEPAHAEQPGYAMAR